VSGTILDKKSHSLVATIVSKLVYFSIAHRSTKATETNHQSFPENPSPDIKSMELIPATESSWNGMLPLPSQLPRRFLQLPDEVV
jgi:hypothetical protein